MSAGKGRARPHKPKPRPEPIARRSTPTPVDRGQPKCKTCLDEGKLWIVHADGRKIETYCNACPRGMMYKEYKEYLTAQTVRVLRPGTSGPNATSGPSAQPRRRPLHETYTIGDIYDDFEKEKKVRNTSATSIHAHEQSVDIDQRALLDLAVKSVVQSGTDKRKRSSFKRLYGG